MEMKTLLAGLKAGNLASLEQVAQKSSASSNALRNAAHSAGNIPKFKIDFSELWSILLPIECALPFDLMTGEESSTGYNRNNPFVINAPFDEAVNIIRAVCIQVPEVKEKVMGLLGRPVDDPDDFLELQAFEENEDMTQVPALPHSKIVELRRPFGARLKHTTQIVQNLRRKGSKYPTRFLSDATVDSESGAVLVGGFASQVAKLESQLCATRSKATEDKMKGENASDLQIESALKAIRDERTITEPMIESAAFIYAIPLEKNNGAVANKVKKAVASKDFSELKRWWRIQRTQINGIEKLLGDATNDLHNNYLEILWECPDKPTDGSSGSDLKAGIKFKETTTSNCFYTLPGEDRKEFEELTAQKNELTTKKLTLEASGADKAEIDKVKDELKSVQRTLNKIKPALPEELIDEAFSEWLKDEDSWTEAAYKKRIFDFRVIPESEIRQTMKDRLPSYQEELLTGNTIEIYGNLISEIDEAVGSQAAIAAATGQIKELSTEDKEAIEAQQQVIATESAVEITNDGNDEDSFDLSSLEGLPD